jgi:protein TonB
MAKDIDLTSKEWLNLIFEGKNKEYGAYDLRESSSDRHLKALVIVTIVGLTFIFLPRFVKSVVPQQVKVVQTSGVVISNIEQDILEKPVTEIKEIPLPTPLEIRRSIQFTPPVIVNSEIRNEMATQIDLSDNSAAISTVNVPEGVVNGEVDPRDIPVIAPPEAVVQKPFSHVEQPPYFDGLTKWLSENIVYPPIAIEKGIEGRVILRFVVGPDGSVTDVEILRSLDPSCDKEAVRVIKKMPKWVPGKQNGNAVSVYYTLPVLFKLQK